MSGADCQDGDSDSFQQVFYSTSRNGLDWTTPMPMLTTDPTFSASAEQEANSAPLPDQSLGHDPRQHSLTVRSSDGWPDEC